MLYDRGEVAEPPTPTEPPEANEDDTNDENSDEAVGEGSQREAFDETRVREESDDFGDGIYLKVTDFEGEDLLLRSAAAVGRLQTLHLDGTAHGCTAMLVGSKSSADKLPLFSRAGQRSPHRHALRPQLDTNIR